MACRDKVVMKRIENATHRRLTFFTRRLALLKQARKLSALCDAEVALIGFSSSGSLFDYAGSRSMQEIIQAYFDTRAGETGECPACFPSFHNSQVQMERLKEEVQRLEKEERRKSGDIKDLSIEELEKLETELACELSSVRHRKDMLIAEQRKEFVRKEQELLRENKILKRELKWARCVVGKAATSCACSDEDTMATADSRSAL